ncbi:hypothetical protein EST38_g6848 [Candolleomyces aberdarensis]|uniref:Uncharacterized protein n=1 Tax=Candolleomyces aberdarensis TaxID=2316362 RepID=A0A4Q2DJJ9_9AGAR|nr:hypothetical protein EST38_g6848 [Candolleomyces aberdarensis]
MMPRVYCVSGLPVPLNPFASDCRQALASFTMAKESEKEITTQEELDERMKSLMLADDMPIELYDGEQEKFRRAAEREHAEAIKQRYANSMDLGPSTMSRQEYLDFITLRYAPLSKTLQRSTGSDSLVSDFERERTLDHKEETQGFILADPSTKHRATRQMWPRDPDGKILAPNASQGKTAPNGIDLWAATVENFFDIRRIPLHPGVVTWNSASRILSWMKKHGEAGYAPDMIEMAEHEPDPEEIKPYPFENLLMDLDGTKASLRGMDAENSPLTPFSRFSPTPLLHQRIPLHLLPKRIIVHDPADSLSASYVEDEAVTWPDAAEDVTHVYRLSLSSSGTNKLQTELDELKDSRAREEKEVTRWLSEGSGKGPLGETRPKERGFLVVPAGTTPGKIVPAVFFMWDAKPCPIAEIGGDGSPEKEEEKGEEGERSGINRNDIFDGTKDDDEADSHLYISPRELTGEGNHSFVYTVEWDLPLSSILPSQHVICKDCVRQRGMEILAEVDGPNGERKDRQWTKKTGLVEEYEEEPVIKPQWEHIAFDANGKEIIDERTGRMAFYVENELTGDEDFEVKKKRRYVGPVRVIQTGGAGWKDLGKGSEGVCDHLRQKYAVYWGGRKSNPALSSERASASSHFTSRGKPMIRVRAIGKLSIEHDDHLVKEADNYQQFPTHFFEHWSGLNMCKPLMDPFPIDALVPQFYGYYIAKKQSRRQYKSPILLLEHCGTSVSRELQTMTIDDR